MIGFNRGCRRFYAEWDQAVFHPDALYEIPLNGVISGATNPFFTFSNIPEESIALTTALSGGNIEIAVPTETGKNYQLQNSSITNWTIGSAISGDGSTNTFTDATDQYAEFYRVEITDNPSPKEKPNMKKSHDRLLAPQSAGPRTEQIEPLSTNSIQFDMYIKRL